ncbi:MAG: PspC domain-containing protein [Calditrichaceae bacterium]
MNEDMNSNEQRTENKRLYRSRANRMIAGVCGGFAEYLNIDPVLVRIAWLAFTFLGGSGLIIYIIGIIIIPENPESYVESEPREKRNDSGLFWGSLLILIGAALLLKQFGFFYYFNIWHLPWKAIWSVLLIIIGILMLYNFSSFGAGKTSETGSPEGSAPGSGKHLYRSRNKMLGGVCAGLAEYFNIDPNLVRLAYALLAIASFGMGLIVYLVLMIVLPQAPDSTDTTSVERE